MPRSRAYAAAVRDDGSRIGQHLQPDHGGRALDVAAAGRPSLVLGDGQIHAHRREELGEVLGRHVPARDRVATARSTSVRVPAARRQPAARCQRRQQAGLELVQARVGRLGAELPSCGIVDELVGVAREAVERVHVRPFPAGQQQGRQVVGATVRRMQPAAGAGRQPPGPRSARCRRLPVLTGGGRSRPRDKPAGDQAEQQREPGEPAADLLVRDVVADRAAEALIDALQLVAGGGPVVGAVGLAGDGLQRLRC